VQGLIREEENEDDNIIKKGQLTNFIIKDKTSTTNIP
jgi:hypothetical protein